MSSMADQDGEGVVKSRQKFRTSCDPCAASKVKCSKEQPRCARCSQHGHNCVYGRSRRKGKPPGSGVKAPRQSQVPPGDGRWHLADMFDTNYSVPALDHLMQGGWEEIARSMTVISPHEGTAPTSSPLDLSNTFPWLDERLLLNPHSLLSVPPSDPDICLTTDEQAGKADVPADTMASGGISPTPGDLQNIREERHDSQGTPLDTNPCERAHDSCIAMACQTLSSLYQVVRGDHTGASQTSEQEDYRAPNTAGPVATSDLVVRATRTATDTVLQLLNCACSSAHDPSLLSLLATIISRIVKWYQVLYDHNIGGTGPADGTIQCGAGGNTAAVPSPASSNSTSSSPQQNTVYTVPLAIGNLLLPRETETKMKAQLLLCEVKPVLEACRLLVMRTRASESTWGEKVICEEFVAHIQQRMGGLEKLLMAACSLSCPYQ